MIGSPSISFVDASDLVLLMKDALDGVAVE
jgi:hypothetical protein